MKNVFDWVKEIKENEEFAKKFIGTHVVSEIIELAKKDGYSISEKDIGDLALGLVAGGGINVSVASQYVNVGGVVTGAHSTVNISPTIKQDIKKD